MSELALKLIAENKAKHERGEDARVLDFRHCGLNEVPFEIHECKDWLEELILSDIVIEDAEEPNEYGRKVHVIKKTGFVQKLKLDLPIVKKVVVSRMEFADLSFLSNLKSLQTLYCQYTLVNDLSGLENLENLRTLNCQGSQITDLSPLRNLSKLKVLNCSYNPVENISALEELHSLENLYLNATFVKSLESISKLKNIKRFDFHWTEIDDLSPLCGLKKLRQVNCSQTYITDLRPLIQLIKQGTPIVRSAQRNSIIIRGCKITTPPLEIIKQGNAAILQYFEELEKAKGQTIRLSEAKCLILGDGGAGKTSLARKLLNQDNELPEEQDTTKGINVHPIDITLSDGTPTGTSDFRLNIWDFGGQEIYHATHQFFLTKRSLYILLDDTRTSDKTVNDASFDYWLQTAELYGGNSPLLIVQNEKGDRSKQLDLKGMQGRYGFVKDSKATNLLTCRGLDEVWTAIEYWLKQLPHIGEEQPKAWVDIRRELERLAREENRDHISLEEYYHICAQHDIPERERAIFLSSYLHDFGAFLHFQDHPLLRKTLVLNNQWATDAVYKVLDCEEVKGSFGRFSRSILGRIWASDRYAEQHAELLALMEKFELCYKLPDERADTWLAPQLLSVLQPEALAWDETDNLQIRYEYEFMPKGLLSQHIVRNHRYIRQTELAWKSGAVFERAGAQALVTEAWGSRNILIRARGANAKELLTLLSEDFDKMHERLEGLKVRKMIPCNCPKCAKTAEPHFYDHEKLQRRKMDGKRTVECDFCYEDVSVAGLLDGVFAKEVKEDASDRVTKFRTIKIFLASSEELLEDRDQFEIFINRENKHLINKGIFLELVRWEDFLDAVSATRLQDEYNKVLSTCDMAVCLFHTKVGRYTAEEFDVALGQFRGTGKPSIFTYFKDTPVKPSQIRDNTINDFKKQLGDIGHFWTKYDALGDLKHHFGEQLKKLGVGA